MIPCDTKLYTIVWLSSGGRTSMSAFSHRSQALIGGKKGLIAPVHNSMPHCTVAGFTTACVSIKF